MAVRTLGVISLCLFLSGCLVLDGNKPQPIDSDIVIIEPGNPWPKLDVYEVVRASVDQDILTLAVAYAGGCREHAFTFYSNGPVLKTLPPGADLWIRHDANGDQCEAFITEELEIDLNVVRADGYDEVMVHVLNYELDRFTIVTYRY